MKSICINRFNTDRSSGGRPCVFLTLKIWRNIMPQIQVTAAQGTLDKNNQNVLMSRLSAAILKAEGADINDPAAKALAWGHYQEIPQNACYVAGELLESPPLIIRFTTPQGALAPEDHASLASEVGELVDELVGVFDGRLNHWMQLDEIKEGGWGSGQIFPLAGIQAAMNIKAA